jgi:hypothetical protein
MAGLRDVAMDELTGVLSMLPSELGRPVIDHTGLTRHSISPSNGRVSLVRRSFRCTTAHVIWPDADQSAAISSAATWNRQELRLQSWSSTR